MKQRSFISPQVGFWGICLIVLVWLSATVLFEIHLGWPGTGVQWAKRIVGWGVELWLLHTLKSGFQRNRTGVFK